MKLPRDLSGQRLATLLGRFGYRITRQTGSHIRLTSTSKGYEHHVTVPAHGELKIGTLSSILASVASHLEMERNKLAAELFE